MSSHRKHPKKPTQPKGTGEFQVGPGMLVDVEFVVTDEDGQAVPLAENRREFVFGYGELLPRLEVALDGAMTGNQRTVTLSPNDSFGRRDPSRVIEVDRDEFPSDVREGDSFEFENVEGRILVMRVLEVTEETVVLDSNHPLAGQRLQYQLTVTSVKPASQVQLAEAERRALTCDEVAVATEPALIAPERLIRSPRPGPANRGPSSGVPATTGSDDSGDSGNEAER